MSLDPYKSPPPDLSERLRGTTVWLLRLQAVIAALTFFPCCFPINFAFLYGEILNRTRQEFQGQDAVSPVQMVGVPLAIMLAIQIVLVAVPAVIASVVGSKRPLLAWKFALATAGGQGLLILANIACLALSGPFALKEFGPPIAVSFFAIQIALFLANAALLWRDAQSRR